MLSTRQAPSLRNAVDKAEDILPAMERGPIGGGHVTDNETAPFGSCITPMRGLDQSQGLVPCITQHTRQPPS